VVDGVILTGARANVHPTHFRTEPHPRHEPYDMQRDGLALALSQACVARGIPLFGICRGLQEMNVAFGGSLHPEIRELPGRINHRMPRLESGEIHPDPTVVFADRHDVNLVPGGAFATLLGCETIRVNSLHGQGILDPGERVVLISRCLPIIRTFISLPAGIARMPFWRFTVLTFLGALPWNAGLVLAGYAARDNWNDLRGYLHFIDYAVILAIVGGAGYLGYRWWRGRRARPATDVA